MSGLANSGYKECREALQNAIEEIAELEAELAEQRDLNKKFRMLPDARIAELEIERDELKADLRYWKKQCDRCANDNSVLSQQRNNLERSKKELEAENQRLKEKLKNSHKIDPLNPLLNGG